MVAKMLGILPNCFVSPSKVSRTSGAAFSFTSGLTIAMWHLLICEGITWSQESIPKAAQLGTDTGIPTSLTNSPRQRTKDGRKPFLYPITEGLPVIRPESVGSGNRTATEGICLPQLSVLGFGLDQDWDVGVCVFPEREEILIRGAGFHSVSWHGVGSAELDTRECAGKAIPDQPRMIEDLLKGGCRRARLACLKIGFTSIIG